MYYASKIRMNDYCYNSSSLTDIKEIFISGMGWYKKEYLYNFLKQNPDSIKVNKYPYPSLIPAVSSKNEKYVRSTPNDLIRDNLLELPRE